MTARIAKTFLALFLALALAPVAALAQATHWVQIEAHATLRTAEDFATRYQGRIGQIAGFRIAGGWYALALGPFATPDEAERRRAELIAAREIREDAYVTDSTIYGQQFWPVGGQAALTQPQTEAPAPAAEPATQTAEAPAVETVAGDLANSPTTQTGNAPQPAAQAAPETTPEVQPEPAPEPVVEVPEETVPEAREMERRMSRDQLMEIQTALQWFGFYRGGIDAQFGPGTRSAIQNWQGENGFDPSGFLTTRQLVALVGGWQEAVARYGFQPFRDEAAGIEITLPLAMVEFERHESPFSHLREINGSHMRVLLISQEGTAATFAGMYEILQTLEVIPLEGARDRARDRFAIAGTSATARAQVEARFANGTIKGWMLLWSPEADADAELVLATMRDSFRAIDGVLPSNSGAAASTVAPRDLISGLEVRRPAFARSGFFIDAVGSVVTSAEAVQGCGRVTIDEAYRADVRAIDEALGIAVITPAEPLVPLAFAQFAGADPAPGTEVRVSGFSYQDTLTRPIVTFGTLAELAGLDGQPDLRMLTLATQPGDTGGPVFDANGAVIGVLLPRPETPGRMLPEDVQFAASAAAIQRLVAGAGLTPSTSRAAAPLSSAMLTRMSADLTVLVSCWN